MLPSISPSTRSLARPGAGLSPRKIHQAPPDAIGYDRAVEIVRAHQAAAAAANTPLKSFPGDADMLVKNGRYRPYIAYKSKNYRLPKGAKPEELTLDDCLKIVAGSKKYPPRTRGEGSGRKTENPPRNKRAWPQNRKTVPR